MSFVSAVLYRWVQKTRMLFAGGSTGAVHAAEGLIFRLKYWPNLPHGSRTAEVLRVLSVMSHRPVNRRWILAHSRLAAERVDILLKYLISRGAVEVIDSTRFGDQRDCACPAVAALERKDPAGALKASTLSMRLPSSATTSKSQSPHSMRSPAAGIWPDTDINKPATVL